MIRAHGSVQDETYDNLKEAMHSAVSAVFAELKGFADNGQGDGVDPIIVSGCIIS